MLAIVSLLLLLVLPKLFQFVGVSGAANLTPTVTSVEASQGPTGKTQTLTIKGTNFFGSETFGKVSSSLYATCATDAGNVRVYCWGKEQFGDLGDGGAQASVPGLVKHIFTAPAGTTITEMTGNVGNQCLRLSNGKAYCWGHNTYRTVGNLSYTSDVVTSPVQVTMPIAGTSTSLDQKSITSIMPSGQYSNCALTSEDKLYCWGFNSNGQVGDGTTTARTTAAFDVSTGAGSGLAGKSVLRFSTGFAHACAVDTAFGGYCWGLNNQAQAGFPSTLAGPLVPKYINGATTTTGTGKIAGANVRHLWAGYTHTCGIITSSAHMYCWGRNNEGQLGIGSTATTPIYTPTVIAAYPATGGTAGLLGSSASEGIIGIGAMYRTTCVISLDKLLYCWGLNDNYQVGNGTTNPITTQVRSNSYGSLSTKTVSEFTSNGGLDGTVTAIATDGTIHAWGNATDFRAGTLGPTTVRTTPLMALGGAVPLVTSVKFGGVEALSFRAVDKYTIIATIPASATPGPVNVSVSTVDNVTATKTNGFTFVDTKPTITSVTPNAGPTAGGTSTTITGSNFVNGELYTQMDADGDAENSVCGVTINNEVYCWGRNSAGQLATGDTAFVQKPTKYPVTDARKVIVGYDFVCVLRTTGAVVCSGGNDSGQLGNGAGGTAGAYSYTPVTATLPEGASDIDAGAYHACAILNSGHMWCWGGNAFGQLGDGTQTLQPTPIETARGSITNYGILTMGLGRYHSCVIDISNRPSCWGYNASGQVGIGTLSSYVLIPTHVDVSASSALDASTGLTISAGASHTCVLTTTGLVRCWGHDGVGQVGDGAIANTNNPYPQNTSGYGTLASKTIKSLASGASFNCAIASDNTTHCWGLGTSGELGNNTKTTATAAVDTTSFYGGATVRSHALGIKGGCALTDTEGDRAMCWGSNVSGSVGDDTTTERLVPTHVYRQPVKLTFGGIDATSVTYNSDTSLTAVTPARPAGPVTVAATNVGINPTAGTFNSYTYYDIPTITSVTPSTTSTTGGATITLSGTSFSPGAAISINGTPATGVTVVNSTTITFTAPANPAGTYDVIVTAAGGTSTNNGTLDDLTYANPPAAPTITELRPWDSTSVKVTWDAPVDGGSPITDYIIQYSPDSGTTWHTFADGISTTTNTTVTSLTPSTIYQFRVAAVNAIGQGPWSTTSSSETLYISVGSAANIGFYASSPATGTYTSTNCGSTWVNTNSMTGFTLTIAMATSNRNLVNTTNNAYTIAPTSGTLTTPTPFDTNSWGYRIDGFANFGGHPTNNPTQALTNDPSNPYIWAGVPAAASGDTIDSSTGESYSDVTQVCYGMRIDNTKASGQYSGNVVYTGVVN